MSHCTFSVSAASLARFKRRNRLNHLAIALSLLAMAFGMFWLLWILWETFSQGIAGLGISMFTENTPPPDGPLGEGGLGNAILGSLLMVALATFIGAPIGILSGVYLAEYNPRGKLAVTVRFIVLLVIIFTLSRLQDRMSEG